MPAYKKMQLLSLPDLVNLECLKLMFCIDRNLSPTPVVNVFRIPNHQYNTRNKNVQNIRNSLMVVNQSFLNKAPILWQNLRTELKLKPTLHSFKKSV